MDAILLYTVYQETVAISECFSASPKPKDSLRLGISVGQKEFEISRDQISMMASTTESLYSSFLQQTE